MGQFRALRRSWGSERIMKAAAHDIKYDAHDKQQRPDHHYVLNVESPCVHPAPDESPDAARNDANDAVNHTRILELLNQYDDETD